MLAGPLLSATDMLLTYAPRLTAPGSVTVFGPGVVLRPPGRPPLTPSPLSRPPLPLPYFNQRLGLKKALVVHSAGLDELTPMAPADIVEVEAGVPGVRRYMLDPLSLGIPRCEHGSVTCMDCGTQGCGGGPTVSWHQILRDVMCELQPHNSTLSSPGAVWRT